MTRKLRTQKDGRLFAIKLLKDISAAVLGQGLQRPLPPFGGEGQFYCEAWDVIDGKRVRCPPQSQLIREAFDRIYAATDEARAGFFVIITERLGTAEIGTLNISEFERLERRGLIRKMPEQQATQ